MSITKKIIVLYGIALMLNGQLNSMKDVKELKDNKEKKQHMADSPALTTPYVGSAGAAAATAPASISLEQKCYHLFRQIFKEIDSCDNNNLRKEELLKEKIENLLMAHGSCKSFMEKYVKTFEANSRTITWGTLVDKFIFAVLIDKKTDEIIHKIGQLNSIENKEERLLSQIDALKSWGGFFYTNTYYKLLENLKTLFAHNALSIHIRRNATPSINWHL